MKHQHLRSPLWPLLCAAIAIVFACASPSWAQFGPRPGGGHSPGPRGGHSEKKGEDKQGPAEAAPEEEKEGEPELPPLPAWPGQEAKKFQLFQMKGYFRFRWNMHHKLNLGLTGPGSPFYTPLSEDPASALSCAKRATKDVPGGTLADRGLDAGCSAKTLGGADIRLRLEPTINISEAVRIHAQLDVLDNMAMGSTPRGLSQVGQASDVPTAMFNDGQSAPVTGVNSATPAIVVKRAWAEVGTPFGQLRFGRMPAHWGLGLLHNDGGCWNCNYGQSNDRLMFTTVLSGHTLSFGYDFASSGPNSATVAEGTRYLSRSPIDLEKLDDVHQFFWVAGKIDSEELIKDRVDRGELVLNYGLYLLYRKQQFDYKSGQGFGSSAAGSAGWAGAFLERHSWMLIPDLWFKLAWKKLYIEFEGVLVGGKMENKSDTEPKVDPVSILQYGWALRSEYRFLRDSLRVRLELGGASGDANEPIDGQVSRWRMNPLAYNTTGRLGEFRFDYDYQVDLILFREILGTIANAFYMKPGVQYNIVDSLGARFDMIYSMTHNPVGWPGNSRNLGLELDLDVFYRNPEDGFFAGLSYGVLFPLGALSRPAAIFRTSAFDAEIAHTLQGRLVVKF